MSSTEVERPVSRDLGPRRTSPGRWVGGFVGVCACIATFLIAGVVVGSGTMGEPGRGEVNLVWVGLGGLPIAFLGGRALLPAARSGDWSTALAVGLAFGLIAPPLGAIEVVAVGLLPIAGAQTGFSDTGFGLLFLLPLALAYSYVVVVLTVPAGLLWALIVRAIPDRGLERLRIGHAT